MAATTRKNTPRLRDGVMKRGTTWSYVIRLSPHSIATFEPRPAATLPSTKCVAALKNCGTPRSSAVIALMMCALARAERQPPEETAVA